MNLGYDSNNNAIEQGVSINRPYLKRIVYHWLFVISVINIDFSSSIEKLILNSTTKYILMWIRSSRSNKLVIQNILDATVRRNKPISIAQR